MCRWRGNAGSGDDLEDAPQGKFLLAGDVLF